VLLGMHGKREAATMCRNWAGQWGLSRQMGGIMPQRVRIGRRSVLRAASLSTVSLATAVGLVEADRGHHRSGPATGPGPVPAGRDGAAVIWQPARGSGPERGMGPEPRALRAANEGRTLW